MSASFEMAMLVSARADERLREEVSARERPCPEFLELEAKGHAHLVDWSWVGPSAMRRTKRLAIRHVAAAMPLIRSSAAVLSDGEHVGLPLAVAKGVLWSSSPHVMIGHDLRRRTKLALLRVALARHWVDGILVFSPSQADWLVRRLSACPGTVRVIPYGVDTEFWRPAPELKECRLVLAVGREHRDYCTLANACAGRPWKVHITDASTHSGGSRRSIPREWPANVERRALGFMELRARYAQAAVVVVPLLPTDFAAGITAVLEAMAMAKALVVSDTEGLAGIVEHGVTGMVVPTGDAEALRDTVEELMSNEEKRRQLGCAARRAVTSRYRLDQYVSAVMDALRDASARMLGSYR